MEDQCEIYDHHRVCSMCGDLFDIECQGGRGGDIGIMRAYWCPTCWNGTVDAVRQLAPQTSVMDAAFKAREAINELCDLLEEDLERE